MKNGQKCEDETFHTFPWLGVLWNSQNLDALAKHNGILLVTKMADGPAGFHFDELNKVRVLEPEISQQTQELKEECKEFVDSKSGCFMKDIFVGEANFLPIFLLDFYDRKTHLTYS